jgi:hypothetical protein
MGGPPSLFGDTHTANRAALPRSDYIQPNIGYGLRIWWAFFWPVFLATMTFAFASTFILRRLLENPRVPLKTLAPFVKYQPLFIAGFSIAISFPAMAYILRKRFRGFRITLLSKFGQEGAERLAPTFTRTAAVWWAYSWRAVIYRLVAMAIVMFPMGWIMGFAAALLPRSASILFSQIVMPIFVDAFVGMFVIYSSILDEDISNFRVALVPFEHGAIAPQASSPTLPPASLPPAEAQQDS